MQYPRIVIDGTDCQTPSGDLKSGWIITYEVTLDAQGREQRREKKRQWAQDPKPVVFDNGMTSQQHAAAVARGENPGPLVKTGIFYPHKMLELMPTEGVH